MKSNTLILFLFLLGIQFVPIDSFGQGQIQAIVKPYLQDANSSSIKILWETNAGNESLVEYGKSEKLGMKASGNVSFVNYSNSKLHKVILEGLEPETNYFYKVTTGEYSSEIRAFKTPPGKGSEENKPFTILAISDTQIDSRLPDKFQEIIEEGVMKYFGIDGVNQIQEKLAFVTVSGDLVSDGRNYSHWNGHFFAPASDLFSNVPVYPSLGNHEHNSQYYFNYFSLPNNGTPAYDQHWYYKDYVNVRVISLDTNDIYMNQSQLKWLEAVLAETATNEQIDFVFLEFHHPYQTEFWIVGEEEYTGEVIKMVEEFSNKSGKPSAHLFGHTHAYSRGQSRDAKHLWVNVASASGNLDYWGEFDSRNYAEYSVSQDEYGFVLIEVFPDPENPYFTLKRISRGNEITSRDNELRDEITVWKNGPKPVKPTLRGVKKFDSDSERFLLQASPYEIQSEKGKHYASHWQVSEKEDFSTLLVDSWKQAEDYFYYENQQANDDLTDELVIRIPERQKLFWRVRYRDLNLNWSDWSETGVIEK